MDREPGVGSAGLAPPVVRPTQLRYYWSPRRRIFIYGLGVFGALLIESVFIIPGFPGPLWLTVPIAVLWVVACPWLAWEITAPGVYETPTGLRWRASAPGNMVFRGRAAWSEIRYFEYSEIPVLGDRVVVVLTSNVRKDVWGANPTMRWHDGKTDNFAELLNERASAYGAPIET
jgi:hypothetical protein